MHGRGPRCVFTFPFVAAWVAIFLLSIFLVPILLVSAASAQESSSSRAKPKTKVTTSPTPEFPLDPGSLKDGTYRNTALGFTCKIPPGWVSRTEEMNAEDVADANSDQNNRPKKFRKNPQVLLAVFSRPPLARGEDVNSSILIAAESASTYPGLKHPAQYFEPVIEVATTQGFEVNGGPYEFAAGLKKLPREDFQKDIGTRVMRQSTLVMLARDYAISFTFIAGTEDEVEDLIRGLAFAGPGKPSSPIPSSPKSQHD